MCLPPPPPLPQYWIGGAANTAKICAVFAQLTVGGKWEGPHVFMVRLRDDQGRIMPGEHALRYALLHCRAVGAMRMGRGACWNRTINPGLPASG